MPATFVIPDYGVRVYGQPDRLTRISVGPVGVYVDGEKAERNSSVVVDKAVLVTGPFGATVSTRIVEPEPPKPKKAPAKRKPAAKPKAKAPAKKKAAAKKPVAKKSPRKPAKKGKK